MDGRAIAAGVLLCGMTGSAAAVGHLADVTLYDRAENRTLPVYHHHGRYYVVGRPGNEYQVRVRNRTGADILAVVSVDGVNAVSGETADWNQAGYVLGAHQAYDIRGWRRSVPGRATTAPIPQAPIQRRASLQTRVRRRPPRMSATPHGPGRRASRPRSRDNSCPTRVE